MIPKIKFLLIPIVWITFYVPMAHANTDISPIQAYPVSWTFNGSGSSYFKITGGDNRSDLGDCSAGHGGYIQENAGGADPATFDLASAMSWATTSAQSGEYTLELGTGFTNSGCSGYGINPEDINGIFYWDGASSTVRYTYDVGDGPRTATSTPFQYGAVFATTLNACNPFVATIPYFNLSWSLTDCLFDLFQPLPVAWSGVFDPLETSFLTRAPWGYVTRFVAIASGTATSTLPTITIPIPSISSTGINYSSPTGTLDLTPWNDLMGTTSMLGSATSTTNGETFRQITEPGWNIFVLVSFAILVIHELLGFVKPKEKGKQKDL